MKTKLQFVFATLLMMLIPYANFGQAPSLGAASKFVIFTTVGAITNSGISQITGNVGTNSGSTSGFGNVNGVMGVDAQSAVDLLAAYHTLDTTTSTFNHAPLLGNGDTLVPGVYAITGATTLNLNLYLDAQGDPNAVFIFQISATLSTGPNAKVKIINGGLACNVFWKVEGLVSLAAGTYMRGTIIANNAGINMNAGDTLEGRALSTNGAITLNGTMAYTPIGCGSPVLTGPIAPALGVIACYTIFSSNGAVTNTGTTYVTGDVGTNVGLTTGFNPLFVTGMIHPIPDGSTAAAASKLLNVYTYLNTLPHDIQLLYPAQFGHNLVLTPHTYLMNSAVTFTDTVFLNGMGDPDAVFVIKVNGALASSTYSRVILTNGTQAKNVFWKIDGAVEINDYSIFNGTIVCNNGAMQLKTGVVMNGRALTTTGILNTASITAIMPPGCGATSNPVIISAPTAKAICMGDTAKFSVIATGVGLTYQWRKGNVNLVNGGNISGATSDTLVIFPTTISDTSSFYNVIVNGSFNPSDTSNFVSLHFNNATIITEPVSVTACLGNEAKFSVQANGSNLTYQWRKGTVNLVNGGTISGANSDTLIISSILISDTASNYNVIVGGSCLTNDSSVNVSLIINTAPIISLEPSNKTACLGSPVFLSVVASGSALTYQWRKGTLVLANSGTMSGVNTDTLKISSVLISDSSSHYNVIVSGACLPKDTSIHVSIIVDTPPIITTEPVNQTACTGNSLSFSVIATGTNLTYQWRNGSVNLTNVGNISGATSSTLTINPMAIADTSSFYNVIVSGTCSPKDTSNYVSLMPGTAPIITSEPINDTVCAGYPASFHVTATGSLLTYQWRKGTVNLVNGTNISGANTNTLTIITAGVNDAATNYNVIVSGGCTPNDTSINAALIVDSATVIITQPSNQTSCIGSSVSFTVTASGQGLTYQWRKGTVNLVNGGNISGATSATLTINPITISDVAANYNVVVNGGCSPVNSSAVGLNSSGRFAILAGTGISTTGFSVISNLDVGIYPGFRSSITGFPPASIVNGAIYAADDVAPPGVAAMLIQAKQELTNAYLFAEGATAPAPITVAGDQGGLTLAPGIYKSTSTLLIQSGNLTLDGQGNANATWIFQIASDFTTVGGAGGSVILIGGAQAKNITWQVGSSATIGNGTSFKGNILALTSITMNTGSTIDGRLLAQNGAVVLSGTNLINSPMTSAIGLSLDTSNYVSLSLDTAPIITSEPTSPISCIGNSVSFIVVATGSNLTYQWRKGNVALVNGGNISGATSATLTINPIGLSDAAANYNVIVSGTCSPSDTSLNASLIVNTSPIITGEPTNQTACVGSSVSFTTIATGTLLSYQWRKGTVNLVDGGNISGATTATLTINPTSLTDAAANYNVIVSGTCLPSDTSINVSLILDSAPIITSEPTNQTLCSGGSASFTVVATGTNLSYQWRKGTVNLVNGGNISGVTTATLTINPASITDAATNYNVIVSGSCLPKDTSINVSLILDSAPIITSEPTSPISCIGNSVSFTVVATGSNLIYQWRKGIVNLVNGGNISGATSATLTINPIGLSDAAANYNVIVSGTCSPSDTSLNASLIVNTLPIITNEPTNQTSCVGSSVSFTTIATGTLLSYQWRKGTVNLIDGGNISGATTATLTINPTSLADAAANYNVIVSGTCLPSDTSINVALILDSAPIITSEPTNQTLCSGGSASFTVVATGTNLSYQWRKGTVNLVNGGNISGATSATLTINPATIADASTVYNVIVSGTCLPKDTSINVSLILDTAPLITSEPTNQTACAGGSASFTVIATGTNLTYQWRKGTVNLVNGGNISGATTATLTINPATIADAATDYNVIVSGTCLPKDTSIDVSLTISSLLTITSQPISQTVCEGSSVSFPITATGAGLTYQWRKGAINIINGGNISGATSATLTINPAGIADAATNYNVILSGTCSANDTSNLVSLTINTLPIITNEPSDQTICSGNSVSFTAIATGTNLTYQWRKGIVNLVNGGNISGATTATLTINPATTADAATDYNVIVSGTCLPGDTSINVALIVGSSPVISTQPSNQIECAGSPVNFTVIATGAGLTYQWRKGNVNLTNGGNISGATSATLTINPASIADTASNYNVVISGSCVPAVTSINVLLTHGTAPFIFVEPVSQTTCEGISSSFTVVATGTNLTYQWRNGTVNLVNGGNISGATSPTLTIFPVNINDTSTFYNVVITGDCAPSVTSVNVALAMNFTGINLVYGENVMSIYPNPFTSSLHFLIKDASQINNFDLMVYNLLGELVIQQHITQTLTTFETSHLPNGLYIYKIIANNKTIQSGKLVSNK